MWTRISILCAALASTWAIFLLDGPGFVTGRARTGIGTVSGPDMNGPSEYRGLITYAERTDVYENMRVVATVWTVNTRGLVGTVVLTAAVWAVAVRMVLRRRGGAEVGRASDNSQVP
jgi:hypothetical protein